MPKVKKEQKKGVTTKKKLILDEVQAYKSLKISAALGCVFLIISFLFNAGIITIFANLDEIIFETIDIFDIIDITIKVSAILLSFLFMVVSIGNYKDLMGKPANWKEILMLLGLSIIQTIRNPLVFLITLIGLIIILCYLYLVQMG